MLIMPRKFLENFKIEKYQHLFTRAKRIPQVDDITMRHYDVIGESHSGYKVIYSWLRVQTVLSWVSVPIFYIVMSAAYIINYIIKETFCIYKVFKSVQNVNHLKIKQ